MSSAPEAQPSSADGRPAGGSYEWYTRGQQLYASGNPAAAAQLLRHAVEAEPSSRAAREALARALFDARQYREAREIFAGIVADSPADDYAHFGLGMAALRDGDNKTAVLHLSLANAMKPHTEHYATALARARSRLASMSGTSDD